MPHEAPAEVTVGVDIGGTFTDFVVADGQGWRIYKVPSTPSEPSEGFLRGVAELGLGAQVRYVHGSTVATNAVLERRGARAALLTTAGFRDVLEIGRQTRLHLYALTPAKPEPLIPRERCFEVTERVDRHGNVVLPLDETELEAALDAVAASGAESLAIVFLFSFANPEHERRAGRAAARLGIPVSLSSEVLPEYREYERASTTAANTYVAPVVSRYLGRLEERLRERDPEFPGLQIMQSNGGIISAELARREAVRTILSGPAGGVAAAWRIAAAAGFERALSFDMGGTSTDVSLIDGRPRVSTEATVSGLPIRVPMLDIHTVGAGGGSLAWLDAGGAPRVGPQSAGADPGPAAYGRGDGATVTDANIVLGRLYLPAFLGGRMTLDPERSRTALARFGVGLGLDAVQAAAGVARIANVQMARALRRVSVERGYDIREFCLVAFGGGGPLHACELAEETGMSMVLIPRYPGILSALGMLLSDVEKEYSRTVMRPTAELAPGELEAEYARLEAQARADLTREGVPTEAQQLSRWADMRYRGQSFELSVAADADPAVCAGRFHAEHGRAFGYANASEPTEFVHLRVRATGTQARPLLPRYEGTPAAGMPPVLGVQSVYFGGWTECPVLERAALHPGHAWDGPALIIQEDTTTLIPPGWVAGVDAWYNVLLRRTPA